MSYRITTEDHPLVGTAVAPPNANLTITGWFYIAVNTAADTYVFEYKNNANTLGYQFRAVAATPTTIVLDTRNDGTIGSLAAGTGTWWFFAMTLGAVGTAGAANWWHCRADLNALTLGGNGPTEPTFTPELFTLGVAGATSNILNGGLYNWKIWSGGTVLNTTQLLAERNSYAPVVTANLWAHYPLLAGDANVINDISGNGRNLSLDNSLGGTENGGGNPTGAPAAVTILYEQTHYRWRNDNGTEVTATPAAAEDTPL